MKFSLIVPILIFSLFGCDRYIQRVVTIEPLTAEVDRVAQVKRALNEVEPLAMKYGFERIEVPKQTVKSHFDKGRQILAWYDTNSDLETPRGSWMYFIVFQEVSSGTFGVAFHQFPNLTEKQEFTDVRNEVSQLFVKKGFRVTLNNTD